MQINTKLKKGFNINMTIFAMKTNLASETVSEDVSVVQWQTNEEEWGCNKEEERKLSKDFQKEVEKVSDQCGTW